MSKLSTDYDFYMTNLFSRLEQVPHNPEKSVIVTCDRKETKI